MTCSDNKKNGLLTSSLFGLAISICIIMHTSLLPFFGIQKLLIARFAPIILYILYKVFNGDFSIASIPNLLKGILILGGLGMVALPYITGSDIQIYVAFLVLQFVIYAYLDQTSICERKSIRWIILIVFFVEVSMGIYERLTMTYLINIDDVTLGENDYVYDDARIFRAIGLFGHPIADSMQITIITIFIMICRDYKPLFKVFVFLLALSAILCYNSRGNIIILILTCVPLLNDVFHRFSGFQKFLVLILAIFFLIKGFDFQSLDLGSRLFDQNLSGDDYSTIARFNAFEIFRYIDYDFLLWGTGDPIVYCKIMLLNTGIDYVENGVFAIILLYGLVFGLPFLVFVFKYQNKVLNVFNKKERIIILFAFWGMGVTNPHISGVITWLIFFTSYYAFAPIENKK